MRLIRFGPHRHERPGVLLPDGQRVDLSGTFDDWTPAFFNQGGLSKLQDLLQRQAGKLPGVSATERLGPPVPRPGKVVCIGLNYADHAAESGMPIPEEPVVFLKAPSTVVGPYDDLVLPRGGNKTDWEVELGVVIGRDARYLESTEDAAAHIAGYCVSHDVSERAFQLEGTGQWTKGKSCDTFNPLGPWLVTPDEVKDPRDLGLTLDVNGERMQDGNTRTMVFDVFFIVQYLSRFMTLEAGDVITTGTPPGVGLGMSPPRYLKPGDEVELAITGLGIQRQSVVPPTLART